MIKVNDLLSLPEFRGFKIISESKGLTNVVSGTGIWEWESADIIEQTFQNGEFVFTTLSTLKNNEEEAVKGLKTLIKKRVAAIAIKSIYFDTYPKEIISLAETYRVPLLVFHNEYIDDLIYTVRKAITSANSNGIMMGNLKQVMTCQDREGVLEGAKKLNPMFFDNLICFCCIVDDDTASEALEEMLRYYHSSIIANETSPKAKHVFIKCEKCIIVLYTTKEKGNYSSDELRNIFDEFVQINSFSHVGVSVEKTSLADMRDAIGEAVSAALNATLEDEKFKSYNELGADIFVLPSVNNYNFLEFYRRTLELLRSYDEKYNSNMIKTIMCYVDNECDTAMTAKKLYQHSNTVRYRLDKVKKIMGLTNSLDCEIQFYMFVRMYKLDCKGLLDEELIFDKEF